MALPVLDFADFAVGTAAQRAKYVHELVKSLSSVGFVKLVNHGFSQEQIANLFSKVLYSPSLSTESSLISIAKEQEALRPTTRGEGDNRPSSRPRASERMVEGRCRDDREAFGR